MSFTKPNNLHEGFPQRAILSNKHFDKFAADGLTVDHFDAPGLPCSATGGRVSARFARRRCPNRPGE